MKYLLAILLLTIVFVCVAKETSIEPKPIHTDSIPSDKIQVLNFATFHMQATTDANSTEFDNENQKNKEEVHAIAKMIAEFKPTIICVELPPEEDSLLNVEYKKYLDKPEESTKFKGEIGLLAFEIGRLTEVKELYGIDHKMSYNYNIANEISNDLDANTIMEFYSNPFKYFPELNLNEEELSILERMTIGNSQRFLDFLILINADMLTHVGSEDGFEGADEAAKFYHRNLRMYANINRIPMTKDDRVFILTGGGHAAFFGEFMKRSPKYEMVNALDYLK